MRALGVERDRGNVRGLMRSTVGFRHPVAGEQITHGTDPLRGTPGLS